MERSRRNGVMLFLEVVVASAVVSWFGLAGSAQAGSATSPIPCAGRAEAIIANTGSVILNAGTLVDSYLSSVGPYGGYNVGSAGNVQAAGAITNNGALVRGTLMPNTPAHLAAVPLPARARSLPLGSPNPGTLDINDAAHSITLAPGNYVVASLTVNAPGAINVSPPGQVDIWVTGNLNLGGNENSNGVPANLAFLFTGSATVSLNGGGHLFGLLYAPGASVMVSSPVFGAVVGKSVTLNAGAAVHFDQSAACQANAAVLDQSFVSPTDLSDGLYGRPVLMAQTYTAGISGTLQGVAIDVTAIDPNQVARIQIETVVGGVPSNVVLGQTRAGKSGDLSIDTVIPFSTPIPQVAGQQYAIVVDYPDAPPFFNGIQNTASWNGADGNPYPVGTLVSSFDNGVNWQSFASSGFDLHFQTFVIPN